MRPVKGAPKSLWVCLRSWSLEHKSFLLPSCPLVEHAAHHALNVADGREHWLSLRNMPDQDDDWTSWTKFSTIHSDRSTLIISPDGSEIPIGQRIQWWSNSYGKKKMAQRRDLTKAYCGRWMGVVKETHSIKNQIKQTNNNKNENKNKNIPRCGPGSDGFHVAPQHLFKVSVNSTLLGLRKANICSRRQDRNPGLLKFQGSAPQKCGRFLKEICSKL